MSVDFYLPKYKIAIEVDGPSHYTICDNPNTPLILTGTTAAKHRYIKKNGDIDHLFQITGNVAQTDIDNYDLVMEAIAQIIQN